MKANRLRWLLLFLVVGAVFRLPAQQDGQAEAERKVLAAIRAKAENGDALHQFTLGMFFLDGQFGLAKDVVEAVKWFRKAADQNLAVAECQLALCYAEGQGVEKNEVEAVRWLRKAADQGDAEAQYSLGVRYENGHGVARDETEAIRWLRKAAEQNLPLAQYYLSCCYHNGQGVTKDEAEAVKWLRKAAERNNAKAQCWLGFYYANGQGVPKDDVEAVKWYRKAAERNNAEAQNGLGFRYEKGQGVPEDKMEAVKWYRKAAEQGYTLAQQNLAFAYFEGRGVTKNALEAVKWLRKAADQDLAEAQFHLGLSYARGDGVAKDEMEAVKWYLKAAEQGDPMAQNNLGVCYHNGDGVPKDYVQAYKWLLLAAAQGNDASKEHVSAMENGMTREQIAEGQELARNFKRRHLSAPGIDLSVTDIEQTHPESSGTGFFITDDGYFITNEHVAGNGAQARVVTEAGLLAAKVVKVDAANDLALLKVEGKFAALPVVASRAMRLGSTVATVGFPNIGLQGFAPKLAKGEIAALSGTQDDPKYFQISVPVQPGNSGGALVDERGNVVGVVAARLDAATAVAVSGAVPENVNYAVKSSFLLSFLESVPEVSAKLKEPNTRESKFEDVVKSAEKAAVLVLVY